MGIGGNIEMWRPFRGRLTGVRTIAFDFPGAGGSDTPTWPMRIPGLARIACRVLDSLGENRVDVLGYSFGGAVAQQLAHDAPDRVRRLILGATVPGLGGVPGNPISASLLLTPMRYHSSRYLRLTARLTFGGRTGDDGAALASHVADRLTRPPSWRGYVWQLAAIIGWSSTPWLHRIRQPTLVLAGERDPLVPVINARILGARIPNAQVEIVRRGGHLFLLDQADDVVGVVQQFLGAEDQVKAA
jgi:poly(3-hydroxyalkanoate) depolymerase